MTQKRKINPAKTALIQRSILAKEIRKNLIAKAETEEQALYAASLTINDILVTQYKEETGAETFHTYKDWLELGYQVRKGEKSFRVWGRPRTATKEHQQPNGETEEERYQLWPMA